MIKTGQLKEAAENALQKHLRETLDYKYALEESCIVGRTNQEGIINFANDYFCKISKYSREELIGQDHRIINSGYHTKEFIRNLWVTIKSGKIWRGEFKNKAKDGTYYWVDTTIVPFLNKENKPNQYIAIKNDITERKKAEENLEKNLKEISDYKYALEESSIVAITDEKGIIKYANQNFSKTSKYSVDELTGQSHLIIHPEFHTGEFISNLWATVAKGKIWRGELKNKAKDGSVYWLDTSIVPFLNEQGMPYKYVIIRADITERKLAEEEIRKLNEDLEMRVKERTEEVEAFSYSISHDLSAPLRAVNGYARMLEEDYNKLFDDEGKRLLAVVRENAKKMGVLIDDLLAFSRLGRKEIHKTKVDMKLLTKNVFDELNKSVHSKAGIKINDLHPVMADYTLMNQVMMNLLSNAIKYSFNMEKPAIEINSEKKNDKVIYSVSDNGAGFDMKYAHKLFGVFQRLHAAEEFEGTGVGLAIVHRIITRHGGKAWANGETGKGATFYFSLPS